jgi:uncharacterized membrane protein
MPLIATLYLATLIPFLILDAIMISLVVKPLFDQHIGYLMTDLRPAPAAAFYLLYIAGLLYLVSLPAIKTNSAILIPAAVIGFMAYGTYEFTSYAIMKDWTFQMLATDLIWGTCLTAASTWIGVTITRMIFKDLP